MPLSYQINPIWFSISMFDWYFVAGKGSNHGSFDFDLHILIKLRIMTLNIQDAY